MFGPQLTGRSSCRKQTWKGVEGALQRTTCQPTSASIINAILRRWGRGAFFPFVSSVLPVLLGSGLYHLSFGWINVFWLPLGFFFMQLLNEQSKRLLWPLLVFWWHSLCWLGNMCHHTCPNESGFIHWDACPIPLSTRHSSFMSYGNPSTSFNTFSSKFVDSP